MAALNPAPRLHRRGIGVITLWGRSPFLHGPRTALVRGGLTVVTSRWCGVNRITDASAVFLVLLMAYGMAGCAPTNREQLVKEVLNEDPAFTSILKTHQELANQIETYQRELALKRSTVERTIAQLRKDLAAAAATVRNKTAEAKKQLEPERERLELALAMAAEELRAKQSQRASLGRSVSQLKKAIKTASAVWTEAERGRQEAQIQEMLRDASRLDRELAALKAHVRLLKVKLLLLRL